jgi:membrane-bound lytic murein transglycosylase A
MILMIFFGCGGRRPERPPTPQLPPIHELPMVALTGSELPHFSDDLAYEGVKEGILQSIAYLKKIPPDRMFEFGEDRYSARHLIQSMERFIDFLSSRPTALALNQFISDNYRVYQSRGRTDEREVLFTGYFQPLLKGSRVRRGPYLYPVHGLPRDLLTIDLSLFSEKFAGEKIVGKLSGNTVIPYDERKKIVDDPGFENRATPIAWVSDPVALFFLHIQGSGKIVFENGDSVQVNYQGQNGRPYRSIGQYLIENGKIPVSEVSMQSIAAYLNAHRDEMPGILNYNGSYVFFTEAQDGPFGCIQTLLVPGRSIALDRKIFPISALAFIEAKKPVIDQTGRIAAWSDFSRFVLNQDTGGAIKGPGRVDIYWGEGEKAEITAGHLKHPGKLYFLVLRP